MRTKILAVLLLGFTVSLPSFAEETTEDISHEHHEVNPEAGYKGGFFISSPDENFSLKLKGRVQPWFKAEKKTNTPGGFYFQLRRAALITTAVVHKDLTLSATILHAPNPKFNNAQFAYVTAAYTVRPEFVVTAGMVGLPLDMLGMMSSSDLLFVDFPIAVTRSDDAVPRISVTHFAFGSPDGLGINFNGDIAKWHYTFGIVNANEDNYNIDTKNKKVSVGGNVAYDIFESAIGGHSDLSWSEDQKLSTNLGFNYQPGRKDSSLDAATGKETLSGANINKILTGSAGVQYKYRGFAINTEGYLKKSDYADRGSASAKTVPSLMITDLGYYITTGYFLIPKKLEGAGTWSYIRRAGPDNDSYEFGGAMNYYIHGRDMKLTAQYTRSTSYLDIIGDRNSNVNTFIMGLNALF